MCNIRPPEISDEMNCNVKKKIENWTRRNLRKLVYSIGGFSVDNQMKPKVHLKLFLIPIFCTLVLIARNHTIAYALCLNQMFTSREFYSSLLQQNMEKRNQSLFPKKRHNISLSRFGSRFLGFRS
jgi:hypothetical protein